MKTLVLLSALALLALQVQADPIQNTDEETKTQEQPGEEDQAVSVSFVGECSNPVMEAWCLLRQD